MFYFHFILVALLLIILPTDTVNAVAPGGFVTCEGPDCSACNLVSMANKIIVWLFTVIALIFAVLMAVAGFGLVTSGGNQVALGAAKDKFKNGIIGLIIVMAAWLLIDSLMLGLIGGGTVVDRDGNAVPQGELAGWGPWAEVTCFEHTLPLKWAGDPDDINSPLPHLPGPDPTACQGSACVPMGIPCKDPNSCNISPDLVPKLQAFHAAAGVSGARATEGMPPSRNHRSTCHKQGTCIDYSKAGGMTGAEVVSVINAANANGLRPVYEVITDAQKRELEAQGAPSENIKVLGNHISAPHFSIYGY